MPSASVVKYLRFFLRFSKVQLLVILGATLIFGYHARLIRFDFTMERLFAAGSPEKLVYEDFKRDFGSEDTTLYVAFKCPDAFSPIMLAYIHALDDDLSTVKGVRDVFSLKDAVSLFPEGISGDFLKREVTGNSVFRGTIVSDDGTTACLWVVLQPTVDTEDERKEVIETLEGKLAGYQKDRGLVHHIAGLPTIEHEYVNLVKRDILTFVPLAIALFFLMLCIYFRNLLGMILPLATVLIAVVWVMGLMVMMGIEFSILSSIVPTLVLILGVANTIHVLSRYQEDTHAFPEGDKREAVARTLFVMLGACFLTSFTTAVGFASLATVNVSVIREFGLLAAGGILLTYFVLFSFVPPVLDNVPPLRGRVLEEFTSHHSDRLLGGIARINEKHAWKIWGVGGAALLLALVGLTRIRRESEWLQEMTRDNPVYKAHEFFDHNLNGIFSVDILLEGREPGAMTDVTVLKAMEAFEAEASAWKLSDSVYVRQAIGYTDLLKELNRARFMLAIPQSVRRRTDVPDLADWLAIYRSLTDRDRELLDRMTDDFLATLKQGLRSGGRDPDVVDDLAADLRQFRERRRAALETLLGGNTWLGLRTLNEALDGVANALSARAVNVMEEARQAGLPHWLPQVPRTLPESREEVLACLEVHKSMTRNRDLLTRMVDDKLQRGRLTLRVHGLSSLSLDALSKDLERMHSKHRDHFKLTITGKAWLAKRAMDDVVTNTVTSLWMAGAIIFVSMVLLFRSLAVGLISIIPNMLPLTLTAGFMGWLGIDLNFSTATIFSVSLGIAVDTTIHYLTRLRLEVQQDNDHTAAMHRAVRGAGAPMIFSTMLLVLGFSAILTSNFRFSFHFGLLGSFALITTLFSDLFITPTLMRTFKPKVRRWETLEAKLKEIDEKLQKLFERTKMRLF